jgi:hypothetical protein
MKDVDGDDWGDAAPPAGVTPGTDCDDADDTIHTGCTASTVLVAPHPAPDRPSALR